MQFGRKRKFFWTLNSSPRKMFNYFNIFPCFNSILYKFLFIRFVMQLSKIEQLCPPTSLPIDQTGMLRIEWNRSMCEDTRRLWCHIRRIRRLIIEINRSYHCNSVENENFSEHWIPRQGKCLITLISSLVSIQYYINSYLFVNAIVENWTTLSLDLNPPISLPIDQTGMVRSKTKIFLNTEFLAKENV